LKERIYKKNDYITGHMGENLKAFILKYINLTFGLFSSIENCICDMML